MRYLVSWHVEVEAEDPVDAAAAAITRARYKSIADITRNTSFTVLDQENGETAEIQISDEGLAQKEETDEGQTRDVDENGIGVDHIGVHASHCCLKHGCMYRDDDCPVESGAVKKLYSCDSRESCYDDEPDTDPEGSAVTRG